MAAEEEIVEPSAEALSGALGPAYPALRHYAELLAEHGEVLGLIGPREVDRLWSRHLVNCAAVCELIPERARVVDIGSGAGLPGIVIAAMRPAAQVELIEPMARRVDWLHRCVTELGLSNVIVTRARAEELGSEDGADVVTARAVASLGRLVPMMLPLTAEGGTMLAIKGARAGDELTAAAKVLRRNGLSAEVTPCSLVAGVPATNVVVMRRSAPR